MFCCINITFLCCCCWAIRYGLIYIKIPISYINFVPVTYNSALFLRSLCKFLFKVKRVYAKQCLEIPIYPLVFLQFVLIIHQYKLRSSKNCIRCYSLSQLPRANTYRGNLTVILRENIYSESKYNCNGSTMAGR